MLHDIEGALRVFEGDPVVEILPIAFRGFYLLDLHETGIFFQDTVVNGQRHTWVWLNDTTVEFVRVPGMDKPWRIVERTIPAEPPTLSRWFTR